ncbi:MAG TPA: Mur ligase family protein [Solirubrobacteraceae bacterium]|jgi:UDP-N-acetylmuramyl tripeptide synthase|nr:Mur ligase family protein [Solirubrobacteraceae bacterium]
MSALDAKILAARAVGQVARRAGRGGGTSLPGKVLTRLDPHAIERLAARLPRGCAVISATNGKTTTAAMAASVLQRAGISLVHNRAGANMAGGVASTLASAARRHGSIAGELGLFEIDEFWLDRVGPQIRPQAVLLANLFRDQLDRYGELDTIADRWAAMVAALPAATQLALNADDPLVADLGRKCAHVTYFGVEDRSMASGEMQHAADSKHCRHCGAAYVYDAVYLGHLGLYRCPECGRERPTPAVYAERVTLHGTRSASFTLVIPGGSVDVALPLPGLYNVYNALGAATLCLALGTTLAQVADGLEHVAAAFGRAERIAVGDHELSVLLIKNPAGANEILRTLALESGELDLLGVLNDRTADGRDVSWVWDADFELLAGRVRRVTCAGTRAAELALRLKYAGIPAERLDVVSDLPIALDRALAQSPAGAGVYALPTYTALLELRAELARRGHVGRFYEREPAAV